MKKSDLAQRLLAIIFFFGGIALIIGVILIIGRDKGFTQSKFHVTVLYKDVGGLLEGAPVRILGVNVGSVGRIGFLSQQVNGHRVEVVLNILSKFRPQLEGRRAEYAIQTEGVLGQKLVEIYVDDKGPADNMDEPIFGVETVNVDDLAQVFAEAAKSFTLTSSQLSELDVHLLSKTLEETAHSMSETAQQMNSVLSDTRYLTIKLKRLMNRAEQKLIEGNLFKVF